MSDIVERLRANYSENDSSANAHMGLEAAAEIEHLRAIEKAAERAYRYHILGYQSADFDANTQLSLLDALGRALDGEKG